MDDFWNIAAGLCISSFCWTHFDSSFKMIMEDLWLHVSSGLLSLKCGCMREMIHLMFGIGKPSIKKAHSNVLPLNPKLFILVLPWLCLTGTLSGQSKPSLREVRRATLTRCWNKLWWDSRTKRNITTTHDMLTSGSNLYVQYFNLSICCLDN